MDCPFERCFVISLARTPERLELFRHGMPKTVRDWHPEVWPAVDGNKLKPPPSWTAGLPLYGCYRSHMQIIEHCMLHDIESYLVLEDDCTWRPDFDDLLPPIIDDLQDSGWQQFYFGGQLLKTFEHPPWKWSTLLLRPHNVNRTHAMAVHKRGYAELYSHMMDLPFEQNISFDSHLGKLHETGRYCVYVPHVWLCGQREGRSTITNNVNSEMYWFNGSDLALAEQMRHQPPTLIADHDAIDVLRRTT